jgi:hypothetical protein
MKYSYIARMLKLDDESATPSYDFCPPSKNTWPWYVCQEFVEKAFGIKFKIKYITLILSTKKIDGAVKVRRIGENRFETEYGQYSCWSELLGDIKVLDNPNEFYILAQELDKETYESAK